MAKKAPSADVVTILMKCIGGQVASAASLAPRIAPLGLNPKMIGEKIAKETKSYEGLPIIAKLLIENRQAEVEVIPMASTLILKALNEPLRDRKKEKNSLIKTLTFYSKTRRKHYTERCLRHRSANERKISG